MVEGINNILDHRDRPLIVHSFSDCRHGYVVPCAAEVTFDITFQNVAAGSEPLIETSQMVFESIPRKLSAFTNLASAVVVNK